MNDELPLIKYHVVRPNRADDVVEAVDCRIDSGVLYFQDQQGGCALAYPPGQWLMVMRDGFTRASA